MGQTSLFSGLAGAINPKSDELGFGVIALYFAHDKKTPCARRAIVLAANHIGYMW